jgi:8-oxo-dGTP pyrophosphatase MutT (NUDIX family)
MIFFDATQKPVEKPESEPINWRVSLYSLVFSSDDKILVIQSNFSGKYELPGGALELTENIADGLARECYEETGYKIKAVSQTPFYSGEQFFYGSISKKFYHSVHLFYEAELVNETPDAAAINGDGRNETAKVEWLSLDQLTEANCHAIHWPVIKMLQE